MSKRYTYARTIVTNEGSETFTADQFDSFDEAIKIVDRGIGDRKMELAKKFSGAGLAGSTLQRGPMTPETKQPTTPPKEDLNHIHVQGKVGIIPAATKAEGEAETTS